MKVHVPQRFSEAIRQKRLLALSIVSIIAFILGMFVNPEFGYAGIPVTAYLIILVVTYRLPLRYNITSRGIYLISHLNFLTLPLALATNFWVFWGADKVTGVEHKHWQETPAILIRSRFNPRGVLLPVRREDADEVAQFVRNRSGNSRANAFS